MEMKTVLTNVAKIIFPILLGGAILYWMYRGEDFMRLQHVLTEEMDWTWMLLSFPFGILAQMFDIAILGKRILINKAYDDATLENTLLETTIHQ